MKNHLQICFLPWFKLNKITKIGPIKFWLYYSEDTQKNIDPIIKKHLDKYFKYYIDCQGNKVDTISICSYGKLDFHIFTEKEYHDLRKAVDVLIFSTITPQVKRAICTHNRRFGISNSNFFELITCNFYPGDDSIAVVAGGIISGGWKIGEIKFSKPWETNGMFAIPETRLVEGFDRLLSMDSLRDLRERIFKSLEWFRIAHTNNSKVSKFAKIIMMTTTLEILLRFPENGKKQYFVNFIDTHIASDKFKKMNRKDKRGKVYTRTLAGFWGFDFYELRSKIVHGNVISLTDLMYNSKISHSEVADLLCLEYIILEFFRENCFKENLENKFKKINKILNRICSNNSKKYSVNNQLLSWSWGLDDIHKALGWIE